MDWGLPMSTAGWIIAGIVMVLFGGAERSPLSGYAPAEWTVFVRDIVQCA